MVKGEKLREWKKSNRYQLAIDFNRNSEQDKPLIEKLESLEHGGKAKYVKGLIRQDIEGGSK